MPDIAEHDDDTWDDGFDEECSWCCGDGYLFGDESPAFDPVNDSPDDMFKCSACGGTGKAKDQVLW